jgi:hypothetical protein
LRTVFEEHDGAPRPVVLPWAGRSSRTPTASIPERRHRERSASVGASREALRAG